MSRKRLRRSAESEGLSSFRDSASQKVFRGVSTVRENNRAVFVEELKI